MPKTYATEPANLESVSISDDVLLAIGRLVRAFAEIEDLITLYICRLANLNEGRTILLLGRAPISKRLEIAGYLAEGAGEHVQAIHAATFDSHFFEALSCRNTVAHGTLLGQTPEGLIAFLTARTYAPTGTATRLIVESYLPNDISAFSVRAEQAIPLIEKRLGLGGFRKARLQKALSPHPKGQPKSSAAD